MKKLFNYADKYIRRSTWKDFALLKFCLFAIGVLAGMQIPEKNQKTARIASAVVFTVTYIPLMMKFLSVIMERDEPEGDGCSGS